MKLSNFCRENGTIGSFIIERQFPIYEPNLQKYYFTTGKGLGNIKTEELLWIDVYRISQHSLTWGNQSSQQSEVSYIKYSPLSSYTNRNGILTYYHGKVKNTLTVTYISEKEYNEIRQNISERRLEEERVRKLEKQEADNLKRISDIEKVLANTTVITQHTSEFERIVDCTVDKFILTFPRSDNWHLIAHTALISVYMLPNGKRPIFTYKDSKIISSGYISESTALMLIKAYITHCLKHLESLNSDEAKMLKRISTVLTEKE